MTHEELLRIWVEKEPSAKSPYGLYGYPAMWEVLDIGDGRRLMARPGRTHEGTPVGMVEVDGVHYQWQRDGKWVGQGYQATIKWFEQNFDRIQQSCPE